MKTLSIQVMFAVVVCTLAFANNNFAQVLDKKVTITLNEVSIEEALQAIERLTNVKFFYSIDQLNTKEKVSLDAVDQPLREILNQLSKQFHIEYNIHEKRSVITLRKVHDTSHNNAPRRPAHKATDHPKTRMDLLAAVTGHITHANTQEPMPGVNVLVKGTTIGTTSDAEGKFSIEALQTDILVFSFIGFRTVEIQVNTLSVIDVEMEEDITGLGAVVINAGYWLVDDKERTGNIVKITSEDIEKQPVSNPIAALQARVPGLEIVQQTGVPGGNFTVRIRGQNSIANGNDPLYIIDGVPYNGSTMAFNETSAEIFGNALGQGGNSPLNAINPSDLESIEVLKDADATAIYGSRGSNGVILITTKKGKSGKTKIDFNLYSGIGKVASKMNLLNTQQYVRMRKEAFANENDALTPINAPDLLVWDTTRHTDWQEELLGGSAPITDAQLHISGGDKYTQFLFGLGYHEEGTVFPGKNTDRRYSTTMNLNSTSKNEKLNATVTFKYSFNDTDLIKKDLTGIALTLPPNAPLLYDEHGELNWGTDLSSDTWVAPYLIHPLSYLKTAYEATSKNLFLNSVARYAILPNLEVRTNVGFSDLTATTITTTPASSLPPTSPQQNGTAFSNSNFRNWTVEPIINWKPDIKIGRLDILFGTTFLEQMQEGLAQYASGFTSEALMKNIGSASTLSMATNQYSQYRYHAMFGRVNYSFRKKYILNLTGRRDGSSRFGQGKQFSNFGAIGAAWIFSEETFIHNSIPFVSFGKLRGSLGVTGNDQLGNYQYLDTYTSSGKYQETVALRPVRLANPSFAWETNNKIEGAIELGFLQNRIMASASYYRNRSSNQLVGLPLPPTTGFTTMQANLPATIENRGLEIEITSKISEHQNFSWTASLNLTIPRNELIEFPDLETSPAYRNTLVVGEPLSILKRYEYVGVDPQSGFHQFEDITGDGVLNSLDQKSIRFVGQTLYGGLHNSFLYKGFQLEVLLQFVEQTKTNYLYAFGMRPGSGLSNQPVWVLDRWQNPGDISEIQRFGNTSVGNAAYTRFRSSTNSVSDGSYVRLKNLHLSYSLSQNVADFLHMDAVRFFLQGQNLLTWTKFKGIDPEIVSATSLPPLRVYTLGLNVTF